MFRYFMMGVFFWITMTGIVRAQVPVGLEYMFYSAPYFTLMESIRDASKKHEIYTYIIANLSTPGFDMESVLPRDDIAVLKQTFPNGDYSREVMVEFVMARMSLNTRRYSALIQMWGGKKNSLNRVVTLGK